MLDSDSFVIEPWRCSTVYPDPGAALSLLEALFRSVLQSEALPAIPEVMLTGLTALEQGADSADALVGLEPLIRSIRHPTELDPELMEHGWTRLEGLLLHPKSAPDLQREALTGAFLILAGGFTAEVLLLFDRSSQAVRNRIYELEEQAAGRGALRRTARALWGLGTILAGVPDRRVLLRISGWLRDRSPLVRLQGVALLRGWRGAAIERLLQDSLAACTDVEPMPEVADRIRRRLRDLQRFDSTEAAFAEVSKEAVAASTGNRPHQQGATLDLRP
ncbi:MAG: hypothetical protein FJX77_06725 [Armatimonadetes bacterium]|nr:hypothetical protein [Armatimonadota bacterium]